MVDTAVVGLLGGLLILLRFSGTFGRITSCWSSEGECSTGCVDDVSSREDGCSEGPESVGRDADDESCRPLRTSVPEDVAAGVAGESLVLASLAGLR